MPKTIHSTVQAAIDSKNYTGVILCRMEFDSPVNTIRLCNAFQSIYWDEGSGEVEYEGTGDLASIGAAAETNELGAQNLQLTLSGISSDMLTNVFSTAYAGKPIYLWYATLNPLTFAVHADSPVLFFAGNMDYATIEFGKISTVTLNAVSRLADWERPTGGRFNDSYQRTYVDLLDSGFKDMVELQNKSIAWGSTNLLDPPVYEDPDDSDYGCFKYGTKFIMQDGSLKEIQHIKSGDYMLKGGLVKSTVEGLGDKEHWYDYKGIFVTGTHFVYEEGIWLPVSEALKAVPASTLDYFYSLQNQNNVMVAETGVVFADYYGMSADVWGTIDEKLSREFLNSRVDFNEELLKLKV